MMMIITAILIVLLITITTLTVSRDMTSKVAIGTRGRRIHNGTKRFKWVKYTEVKQYKYVHMLGACMLLTIAVAPLAIAIYYLVLGESLGGGQMAMLNIPLVGKLLGFRGSRRGEEREVLPITHQAFFKDESGELVVYSTRPHHKKYLRQSKIEVPTGSIAASMGQKLGVICIKFPRGTTGMDDTSVATMFNCKREKLFDNSRFSDVGRHMPNSLGSKFIAIDEKEEARPYRLRMPKTWMGHRAMASICKRVLDRSKVKVTRLVSPHPRWPIAGGKNEIYLVYNLNYEAPKKDGQKKGTMVFNNWEFFMNMLNVIKNHAVRMADFIRAGKDIFSTPIAERRIINVLIAEREVSPKRENGLGGKAADDGNFNLVGGIGQPSDEVLAKFFPITDKEDTSRNWFYRAVCKITKFWPDTSKGFFIGKGRGITMTDGKMYDLKGNRVMRDDIHCVTTIDNLKWLSKEQEENFKPGTVIKCIILYTKDETTIQRIAYKLNMLALVMGHWTIETTVKITELFGLQFGSIAEKLNNPDGNLIEDMKTDAMNEKGGLNVAELRAKKHLGLTNFKEDTNLYKNIVKKGRSVAISASDYVGVVFKFTWCGITLQPGQVLVSNGSYLSLYEYDKVGGEFTLARYPLVSYQSFMRVKHIGMAELLPGRMIVMHPDDAVYCQGDGDDHMVMLLELLSTFSPASGEAPFIGRAMSDRGYEGYTQLDLYFKGAVAQSGIGTTFNLMLAAIVGIQDRMELDEDNDLYLTAEEGASAIDSIYHEFGGALDQFAQGIKKNYDLPELLDLRMSAASHIGYDPESLTPSNFYGPDAFVGKHMRAAQIYLGNQSPKMISALMNECWNVEAPKALPYRARKVYRKLDSVTTEERKSLKEFILKGWVSKENRKGIFLECEVGSPVTWHNELIAICEEAAGGKSIRQLQFELGDELAIGPLTEEQTKKAAIAKRDLTRYLDTYGYVAYQLDSMIKEAKAGHMDRVKEHFVTEGLVPRLETINGLFVLASQLGEDLPPKKEEDSEPNAPEAPANTENTINPIVKTTPAHRAAHSNFFNNYVNRGYYSAHARELGDKYAPVSKLIREYHAAKLNYEHPEYKILGISADLNELVIADDSPIKQLPGLTRLLVGDHGVYYEGKPIFNIGTFVKKRRQYNEYNLKGAKVYQQFDTVNYADYRPGLIYIDIVQAISVSTQV